MGLLKPRFWQKLIKYYVNKYPLDILKSFPYVDAHVFGVGGVFRLAKPITARQNTDLAMRDG